MSQAQTCCDTHRRAPYQHRGHQQQQQHSTLLAELRQATILWFQSKSDDCFQLLVQICTQILQHGLSLQPTSDANLRFIEDFEFLRLSSNSLEMEQHGTRNNSKPKAATVPEYLQQFVASCLRARCLSHSIQSLVADKELMDCYYPKDVAYLRHSGYATALFVCLTAIQLDQSSLLSQLNQLESLQQRQARHRRTCSQPNFSITNRLHVVQEVEEGQKQQPVVVQTLMRRIKSLPCLQFNSCNSLEATRKRCQTYNSPVVARWKRLEQLPALSGSSLSNTSSCSQVGAAPTPRRIQLINCDEIKIWTDQTSSGNSSSSTSSISTTAPTLTPGATEVHCLKSSRNSFLANLFGSPPVYTRWYSKSLGQQQEIPASSMLDNFLAINGRKLDKRQHQSLFEGVSMLDYQAASTSTLTATAPLDIVGHSTTQSQSQLGNSSLASCSTTSCSHSSDKMDNQSLAAFLQMSRYMHNNTELEKENAHFRISEACITAIEHVKWCRRGTKTTVTAEVAETAVEDAPYAEQQNGSSISSNNNSAEAVGLQLISRFKDQQLPKLADLKWLVSEQDAPQQLLPLPKPQQQQQQLELESASLTRGTNTWAPPRQQIIFTEHPPVNRSELLTRQHYRCAGCGMHVTRQLQQHFRYCNYLGKYLCTGCHRNQLSAIPAKILQTWDFRFYPVCSFAYRLIEQMYTFPLFHVPDLNAHLYAKQKDLARARRRRIQLMFVRDFIASCRFADREQAVFNAVPSHITNEVDIWSMCDFVDVQNRSMSRSIEELIELSEQHVNNCVLCTGRAFVCEYCKSRQLIYPWQRKVQRCGQCGVCAHYNCWKTHSGGICQRCERLQGRQAQRQRAVIGTSS